MKKVIRKIDKLMILRCTAPLLVSLTIAVQSVSILTPDWIITQELMNNPDYIKFNMSVDDEYLDKNTSSGLWVICQNERKHKSTFCAFQYLFRLFSLLQKVN